MSLYTSNFKTHYFKLVIVFLIFSFILSSCKIRVPEPVKSVFTLSKEQEIRIGKLYLPYYLTLSKGPFPDARIQKYISTVGYKIANVTFRKLPYKFILSNSEEINAFSLPGGPIVINRGLLLHLDSESELAVIIGHELGHINAKHFEKFMMKQKIASLILIISEIFFENNQNAENLLKLESFGLNLLLLKFSRDQEREADRYGIIFAYKAGYDPHGIIKVFKMFKKLEKKHPPEWLLTHPLPESRIKYSQNFLKSLKISSKNLIKNTSEFTQIKSFLNKTNPSYRLVEKAREIISKNPEKAKKLINKALQIYPQNNLALLYKGLLLLKEKDYEKAKNLFLSLSKKYPLWYPPFLFCGISAFYNGETTLAKSFLKKSIKLIPFSGISYYFLGRIYEKEENLIRAYRSYQKALKLGTPKEPWYKDCKKRFEKIQKELFYP